MVFMILSFIKFVMQKCKHYYFIIVHLGLGYMYKLDFFLFRQFLTTLSVVIVNTGDEEIPWLPIAIQSAKFGSQLQTVIHVINLTNVLWSFKSYHNVIRIFVCFTESSKLTFFSFTGKYTNVFSFKFQSKILGHLTVHWYNHDETV